MAAAVADDVVGKTIEERSAGGDSSLSAQGEVEDALASSPLLAELFNGRLAGTLRRFWHRAVEEAREGHQR